MSAMSADVVPVTSIDTFLPVPCPRCGAEAREMCRLGSKRHYVHYVHRARLLTVLGVEPKDAPGKGDGA